MSVLLLEPHYDDATLFAAYTILREHPHVVTCFGLARIQESRGGPNAATRRAETGQALWRLGLTDDRWEVLPVRDDTPDVEALTSLLREIAARKDWERVYAPAVEQGGHEQHNLVGNLAEQIFGRERVISYMTYVRGQTRSRGSVEVEHEPSWPARKFSAMACYASQINLPDTRPWFSDWDREWYE